MAKCKTLTGSAVKGLTKTSQWAGIGRTDIQAKRQATQGRIMSSDHAKLVHQWSAWCCSNDLKLLLRCAHVSYCRTLNRVRTTVLYLPSMTSPHFA